MTTIYIAKKNNQEFAIQPDMLGFYASDGYEIFKTELIPVLSIEEEIEKIQIEKR